jgi:hypothetical protein
VAVLTEIWRHPVKSMQGESVGVATLDADGLHGDREWGVRDELTGTILTGRREPRLLEASAGVDGSQPVVTLPDGSVVHGIGAASDAVLSEWLDRPVSLVTAIGAEGGRAEFFEDSTDDTSQALEWTMPAGRFVDAGALLVLTTASLRAGASLHPGGVWDVRRFRPNLLIDVDGDTWVEDAWCERAVRVGDAELAPFLACTRCTMVTRPQPGLERDLDVYRALRHHHGGTLGVWANVVTPGTVRVGDRFEVA